MFHEMYVDMFEFLQAHGSLAVSTDSLHVPWCFNIVQNLYEQNLNIF